ncbi:MAG: hypothetical protein KDA52_25125, partial [Planctomycetaceae bacterium]|nr:hypothetical protein [Planctomycetaceae bacterium]
MSVKPLRIWLEYVGFRCVTSMLQMLSARQTARIADTLGWLFVNVLPKKLTRYQIAYDNISRAFASPVKDTTLEDRDVIGPQSQISNLKSESERSLHPQP